MHRVGWADEVSMAAPARSERRHGRDQDAARRNRVTAEMI
jgi:hypothetical protein